MPRSGRLVALCLCPATDERHRQHCHDGNALSILVRLGFAPVTFRSRCVLRVGSHVARLELSCDVPVRERRFEKRLGTASRPTLRDGSRALEEHGEPKLTRAPLPRPRCALEQLRSVGIPLGLELSATIVVNCALRLLSASALTVCATYSLRPSCVWQFRFSHRVYEVLNTIEVVCKRFAALRGQRVQCTWFALAFNALAPYVARAFKFL